MNSIAAQIKKGGDMSVGHLDNFKQFEGEGEPEIGFAPVAQNLGVANTRSMGEGEIKVRDYVKHRLAELAGKKKPLMAESKKPIALKKLDKMIGEQWKLYGEQVKRKTK